MQRQAVPNHRNSDACRNCGAIVEGGLERRNWENVCPHCGQLAWLAVGDVVSCEVVSVKAFGVFVELGDGVAGLIHASELPDQRPGSGIGLGDRLRARVLIIQTEERRMALSTWRAVD
jgi:polyribonucleotide nucleotidyltransferase